MPDKKKSGQRLQGFEKWTSDAPIVATSTPTRQLGDLASLGGGCTTRPRLKRALHNTTQPTASKTHRFDGGQTQGEHWCYELDAKTCQSASNMHEPGQRPHFRQTPMDSGRSSHCHSSTGTCRQRRACTSCAQCGLRQSHLVVRQQCLEGMVYNT